ncbi:MAG: UDP-glucose 4-epimerase GalE [Flavobacteriales bacterium]|nr:UDP-glucose 4-epimerase GalE [Flavobacteriales bacterium]
MAYTILVTGGTGFIGSHTAVELIQQGYNVVIADNLSNSSVNVLDGIEKITGTRPAFEKIDLCDKAKVKALFANYKIDAVIHFAAAKAVGESVKIPLHYYRNNLVSLLCILECLTENGAHGKLVFSSSCTVYGQPDVLPVTEDTPIKPAECPYGNTKQISEEIISDTAHANPSFRAINLRYFNPIGAHPSALIGEQPNGVPQNLVPYLTQTAMGIRESLAVYGDDYNTHDGSCIRDYIHVVDLAKAHIKAIERLLDEKGDNIEAFNIGTGTGYSVLDTIKSFERATGVKLNYHIAPRRQGDIEKIYADPTKATTVLGWKAQESLDSMMASAWAWQKHLSGK